MAGRAEGEGDSIHAESATAVTQASATQSSLIVDTDATSMFDAGAQDGEAEQLRASSAALAEHAIETVFSLEEQAALDAMNAAVESAAAAAAVAASAPSTTVAADSTTPTTAASTTAPPTTAAPATEPPTTAPPTTEPPTTEPPAEETTTTESQPSPGGPTAEQWAQLRACESSGNYQIVSSNGLYYGAYQFGLRTWNDLARRIGRSDLDGVLPSQASQADQDAMALALWSERGPQPWPVCGRYLPPLP